MNQPRPLYRDQRMIDADHLKLLAVLHFVIAGLALLGLLFLFAHFTIMRTVFSHPQLWQSSRQTPLPVAPSEIMGFFEWFYMVAAASVVKKILHLKGVIHCPLWGPC